MKTNFFNRMRLSGLGMILLAGLAAQAQLPFKPLGDVPANPQEEQQLDSLFATVRAATASLKPGPDAGFQRRQLANELNNELETFVASHTNSGWNPGVRLWLARNAQMRSAYAHAMDQYLQAWLSVKASANPGAREMAREAAGGLAKLLALTGRLAELDALEAEARQAGQSTAGSEWSWAREMRAWAAKHPTDAYKCGLHCLDQLGRLTQPGQFRPKDIVETASSTNGFTAAQLVGVGTKAGLRVHAALLNDYTNLPVPCVLHLRSEHFVVVRERRGAFYDVYDTAAFGPRWLTAEEVAREASGCVLVSDASPPSAAFQLTPLGTAAANYRGRCHGPLPWDHDDSPCPPDTCCPPGGGSGGGGSGGGGSGGSGSGGGGSGSGGGGCQACPKTANATGMASWFVSEPFLNLWLEDTPLAYQPAYGPDTSLRLAYTDRRQPSVVSGQYWHGTLIGATRYYKAYWSCSWLSFAELSADEYKVDLMLPRGGWATFNFPTNSSLSTVNYRHNLILEKAGSPSGVTNLVLHYPDGSQTSYSVSDTNTAALWGYAGLFYMSDKADATGQKTTFTYDENFYLTNVAAADGTTFALHHDDPSYPTYVTSISSSYGASVSFGFGNNGILTNITDAGGISSQIAYEDMGLGGGPITQLITPYGTTQLSTSGDNFIQGVFDRTVRITLPNGTQEFYGQMNTYTNTDWPDFTAGQIPTNTPIGTLDTDAGGRLERNTFYWNAQQFAPYVNTSLSAFNWAAFNSSRIHHWLANTDPTYTHWDTLSAQQEPSPDGTTNTQGQLTWYDYTGKSYATNYEVGTQIMPAVVARVMPDGTTWYQYFQRLTNGNPTKLVEKWADGNTAHYRTNTYAYAANNVDLTLHTGPNNEQVSSNVFNAYHQVVTNYDALNQLTTYKYDATTLQLTSVTRPSGLVTTNNYNGSHRLQSTTDLPINRTESFTWGADGNVKSVTDARGLTVTNYWDGLNRLTGTRYPDSTGTTNLYTVGSAYPNSSGGLKILDLTATKDRLGNWTYSGYDALRRRVAETNANGGVRRYGYCDCGAVAYVTNAWSSAAQLVTWFEFDNQGNRIYTHYPDATVTNWFDSLRRPLTTCDAWGCRSFGYDNLSRLTSITNAFGAEQLTTYDLEDRPIYVTDANNVTLTNTYDDLGRLRTRTAPDGGAEKFGYSARGLIAYTNQLSFTNFYAYDEAGRKTFETNANWELIRYTNSAAGDLLSLTDGKTQTTRWNYDEYGRVTNKLDQAGAVILRYTYDADSRLASRWSAAKGTTYYTNDAVGNLTKINYPVSPDVTLSYDALNRVTNMLDAVGTTKYSYAAGGQLWTEDGPWASDTVTNGYSNRLRTSLSLAQPTGSWTNAFNYDGAKRLTSVSSPAGAFTYTYHASRITLLDKIALPNTSYITNTYDTVARLTGTWLKNSSHTILDSATYGYNAGHQRTTFTNAAGTYLGYTYDKIGQLKVADSSVNSEDRGYKYDAAWNLNYRTNGGTLETFTVDGKNQLTSDPVSATDNYDGNGNLTNRYNVMAGAYNYSYDDENQLTSAEQATQWRGEFVYDGKGRLRKRLEYTWNGAGSWVLSTTTCYVYDGMRVIQERNSANTPLVSYTRGTDLSGSLEGAGGIGGLLARSHGYASTNGNWYTHNFYHAEGTGT